jgi:hypothetical protein
MLTPEHKLFRCQIWEEDAGEDGGGLFVEFRWAKSVEEIEGLFHLATDEKLYKAEECSPEVREAWEAGYDDGILIGIVGERTGRDSSASAIKMTIQDLAEEFKSHDGE